MFQILPALDFLRKFMSGRFRRNLGYGKYAAEISLTICRCVNQRVSLVIRVHLHY